MWRNWTSGSNSNASDGALTSILFVCTGNICRSPLAEGIMREKLEQSGIHAVVDSCGFESFHAGDAPDPRAQTVARKHGIDISGHRARLFRVSDFDNFEQICVMDASHYQKVMRHARSEHDRARVDYTLNALHPGRNEEVMDPWYHDMKAFEEVFALLDKACEAMVSRLFRNHSRP